MKYYMKIQSRKYLLKCFFINNHLHEIYKKYGVKYVLYGHTHFVWKEKIDGIEYISNALGYYGMKN